MSRSETAESSNSHELSGLPDSSTLAVLAEVADLGYFQVDAERNIVSVSPTMERITGFSAEEVMGRSCLTLIRCQECLQGCGVFRTGQVHDHKMTLYRKDGTEAEVSKSGRALKNEAGEIIGAIETVRPVASLRAGVGGGSAELDGLMGSLGRYYLIADEDLRIIAASSALPEYLGIPAETLVDMPLEQLLGEEMFGRDSEFIAAVLEGRRREGWRAFLKDAKGRRRPVSITVGPMDPGMQCGRAHSALVAMIRPDEESVEEAVDADTPQGTEGVVARSPSMQKIFRLVELLRDNDSTVLVTGESGTGKDLVARALHRSSHRASGPFVAVNCAALPGELLESELFGHTRGAFTGAVRDRAGRFELADGGTLFLDEIGDLALPLQAKLLRVLQEHSFERVGGTKTHQVNVRVVAATNANLAEAVADHRFREDLYYRLRVVPIEIPPLRERREDLEPLVAHLLEKIGRGRGRSLRLAPLAMRALLQYPWPGNVRELENALEYANAVCEGQTIHLEDLPAELAGGDGVSGAAQVAFHRGATPVQQGQLAGGGAVAPPPSAAAPPAGAQPGTVVLSPGELAEAQQIREALETAHYSRLKAAELLGMSRTTLWRKMRQYHLE